MRNSRCWYTLNIQHMQFYVYKIRRVLNVQYVQYCAVLYFAPLGSAVHTI